MKKKLDGKSLRKFILSTLGVWTIIDENIKKIYP